MSNASDNVIGALLHDSDAYWRIASIVTVEDFPPAERQLFTYIVDGVRAGEARDHITAMDAGFDALSYRNAFGSSANIEGWAKLVAEDGERVRIRDAGRRIEGCDTYDEALNVLAAVRPQQAQRVKTVKDGVAEILEQMRLRESGVSGLSWGVDEIDDVAGRLVGSRLYGIAGRAKMGKTTLSLRPQVSAVLAQKRVLSFSLEMTTGELTKRALAMLGQFSHDYFERDDGVPDEAWPMIHAAAKQIIDQNWMIDDQPGLTMAQIVARAKQHHMEAPLDEIVIDHMGLIQLAKRANRNDELGEVSYGFKNLAKELNVPILCLLQLNRGLESRENKRPTMIDIRDSGNIEQDFDCILGVYRDEVYNPQSADAGHAEIITLANRHRKPGTAFVSADLDIQTYGPPKHPRRCFPTNRNGGAGGNGERSSFAKFGAQSRQPSALPGDRHVD